MWVVVGRPSALASRHHDFELIAVEEHQLQAVGAGGLGVAHALADFIVRLSLAHRGTRVCDDARRDDRVLVALLLPALALGEVAAKLAGRGHARGQVQVAFVLDRLRHAGGALFVPVHVRVDQAWHHVLPGAIDHRVGRRAAGAGARSNGRDDARLHHDVHRAEGRLGVAVNHHRVADDQPFGRAGVKPGGILACGALREGGACGQHRAREGEGGHDAHEG